jgi:hypothetical protein
VRQAYNSARALGARAGGATVGSCGPTTAAATTVTTYTCSQGWKKPGLKKTQPSGFFLFFCFFGFFLYFCPEESF